MIIKIAAQTDRLLKEMFWFLSGLCCLSKCQLQLYITQVYDVPIQDIYINVVWMFSRMIYDMPIHHINNFCLDLF